MSIGQLGSAGEQFRDFLGGGQQDIGRGLQAILGTYSDPAGNFIRLNDRSQGMYQLTSSEHQSVFDRDAQNQFAETWYSEYRAVLLLRAEALKKKLNRGYTEVLENSIYAPLRPNEEWAPGANRDYNDIDASNPTSMFANGSGTGGIGVIGEPVIPTETEVDTTKYIHPDWFSGSNKYSGGSGNAYDDIRRYMNTQFLNKDSATKYEFDDIDGDGNVNSYNPGPSADGFGDQTPYDDTYNIGDTGGPSKYYDLWRVNSFPLGPTVYDLNSPGAYYNNEIALEMNVPPSTDTTNFVASGGSSTYYIQMPTGDTSATNATAFNLLPTYITSADLTYGGGVFSTAEKTALQSAGGSKSVPAGYFTEVPAGSGKWVLNDTAKFYDPAGDRNQNMFSGGPYGVPGSGGPNTGIGLNPQLVSPRGQTDTYDAAADVGYTGGAPAIPVYQQGFVDSWREARQIQKREAQIEAAYQAYLDGKNVIDTTYTAKGEPPMSYEEMMDQVFAALDQMGGSGGPLPPGGGPPPAVPPSTSSNMLDNVMPYAYYVMPDGTIKHTPINSLYQVGADHQGPGSNDVGSMYNMIYDRLAMAADPVNNIPGASSGPAPGGPDNPGVPPPPAAPAPPPPPAGQYQNIGGPSNLFTPIPVGAAENANDGQPNINNPAGTGNLNDTFFEVPTPAQSVAGVSKLFVGRQWDYVPGHTPNSGQNTTDGVGAVKYDAETISSHLMVLPGWWYDGSGTDVVGKALVTLPPAIDSLGWQSAANTYGLGKFDDLANKTLGGPFFHVGGGSDSLGFIPSEQMSGGPAKYSMSPGFGMGFGGIYWGHTSAIGTVYKIEELMENSNGANAPGFGYQSMKASLTVMAGIGGGSVEDMSIYPNVGIAGFHFDFNFPIPIPPPTGPAFLNVPLTTYGAASYDILTDYLYRFLENMKHEVLDSVSVYSYATGGGYAMDSYGMRGEYSFTEKPAFETLEEMPDIFGIVPVNDMLQTAVDMLGLDSYTMNNYDLETDGIFGSVGGGDARRHSMQAAEARELDTGAFFTTAAFMSQFQLSGLEYSYWSSSHQNEEVANMDTLRMLSLTGKELMKVLNKAIFTVAGRLDWEGPWAAVTLTVLNFMLQSFQSQVNEAIMWDVLLRDQNETGFVTSAKITNSSLTSEGYDFIEDERKLFAYDYEETRKLGTLGKLASVAPWGMGSFELPNQVLNGMANTRRFKPYLRGPDGRAGRQGFSDDIGPDGNRLHELSNHRGDPNYFDNNWDIRVGFWQDTGLGDINEVYVRKNTVSYTNNVTNGIQGMTPTVTTEIDRYVGSHNRIIGRSYDGATPLNLQSFRTGYFANKYFGDYIAETDGTADNMTTYTVTGGIDNDPNRAVTLTVHGGQKYYNRINDYSFEATAGSTTVRLNAANALAPVFGGNMKLMEVDQNDPAQQLGASTQGQTNALTQILYDHMRVRADGSNAQLVKEYRDVFNLGLLDDMFITASANAAMGGGVTSSIRLKFGTGQGDPVNLGLYEDRRGDELVGTRTVTDLNGTAVTQNLMVEPGYLGSRDYFKNTSRAMTEVFLSSYFAFKRQPTTAAK